MAVTALSAVLLAREHYEAMRVPRVKPLDIHVPRLGVGLDGTRVAVPADTHCGPIDRRDLREHDHGQHELHGGPGRRRRLTGPTPLAMSAPCNKTPCR